jgi:hypothetical protein
MFTMKGFVTLGILGAAAMAAVSQTASAQGFEFRSGPAPVIQTQVVYRPAVTYVPAPVFVPAPIYQAPVCPPVVTYQPLPQPSIWSRFWFDRDHRGFDRDHDRRDFDRGHDPRGGGRDHDRR